LLKVAAVSIEWIVGFFGDLNCRWASAPSGGRGYHQAQVR
jgi:hypothetical protein